MRRPAPGALWGASTRRIVSTIPVNRLRTARESAEALRALLRPVADGFDVVAVGVEHERRVVRRVVVLAQPRLAVVGAAGMERCSMEAADGRPIPGCEGDVGA